MSENKRSSRSPSRPIVDEAWHLVGIDEKASQVKFASDIRDDEKVVGNPDKFVQVFVNLFRNALIAIEGGGHIWTHARRYGRDGKPWVCMTVRTTVPGSPKTYCLISLMFLFPAAWMRKVQASD